MPDTATELDGALREVAVRLVERGTRSEVAVLEAIAAVARGTRPGAAAALVDWDGTEVARLRAFGDLHGAVLRLSDPYAQAYLLRLVLGDELRMAG